jgi:hypothetical protein
MTYQPAASAAGFLLSEILVTPVRREVLGARGAQGKAIGEEIVDERALALNDPSLFECDSREDHIRNEENRDQTVICDPVGESAHCQSCH